MTDLAFGVVVGTTFFGVARTFEHLVSRYRARPRIQLHRPRLLALLGVEHAIGARQAICDLHDIGGAPEADCGCSPQRRALRIGPPSDRCTHGATHCNTCGW